MKTNLISAAIFTVGISLSTSPVLANGYIPEQLDCKSLEFPVYKTGKGSHLIFAKNDFPNKYSLKLETLDADTNLFPSSNAVYYGREVFVGRELKKISFYWSGGSNTGGIENAFDKIYEVDLNVFQKDPSKIIFLQVKSYIPNSNPLAFLTTFIKYTCD